jgi:predicted lipoprotein with Yx(FWY)xxD motif
MAVNAFVATSTSSTSTYSSSVGTFTCGPVAGSSDVKLRHTSAATGVTISSPAFTARCADNPYTYTVSLDKASYSQGEIGTMTVSFLDSKGFKANSVIAVGGASMIMPMLTLVTATGSATALTDANGEIKYTFTVGTTSGMTAGTFSGIVDFTALTAVAAVKATPTYKLSTGGDTTTNADILKSIVALIASINKQIQALQKLILKR